VLVGSAAQIAADMHERRTTFGISYYVFSDTQADDAAQVLRALG
jgi:hypothetical protein